MFLFILNLLLALGWAFFTGSFAAWNLLLGFAVAFLTLWVTKPLYNDPGYFRRLRKLVTLMIYFLYELIVSSVRVVWDVITPTLHTRPGIVAVPLDARTETEIMLVANLISLTPGTLSLDISEDRQTLYVHAMFIDGDLDDLRAEIKAGMERRVLEVTR